MGSCTASAGPLCGSQADEKSIGETRVSLRSMARRQAFVADAEDRHAQTAAFKQYELVGAYRAYDAA